MSQEDSVRIRNMSINDLDVIQKIELESFDDPYDEAVFLNLMANRAAKIIVAERSNVILGYAAYLIKDKIGLLVSIAVNKDVRREGIGSRLLERAIGEMALKVMEIRLQVAVTNGEALKFYSQHQFYKETTIRNYYRNGLDAYVLVRRVEKRKESLLH